jgi:hypothetical protein
MSANRADDTLRKEHNSASTVCAAGRRTSIRSRRLSESTFRRTMRSADLTDPGSRRSAPEAERLPGLLARAHLSPTTSVNKSGVPAHLRLGACVRRPCLSGATPGRLSVWNLAVCALRSTPRWPEADVRSFGWQERGSEESEGSKKVFIAVALRDDGRYERHDEAKRYKYRMSNRFPLATPKRSLPPENVI